MAANQIWIVLKYIKKSSVIYKWKWSMSVMWSATKLFVDQKYKTQWNHAGLAKKLACESLTVHWTNWTI